MSETIVTAGFDLEAALASLPACVRCRNRRIKCDTSLPACTNCEKASEICRYRDHVLASTVSRPDLTTLVARYRELIATKQLHPNDSQILRPLSHPEYDLAVTSAPSLHISDPQSPNDTSFWGSSSIYAKLGAAMITLKRLPPPELMLEKKQGGLFDMLPRPDPSGAILPGLELCRRLLKTYHTSIEPFYPIFDWDHLTLLIDSAYTLSPIQSSPILFLLLAVTLQALSRVDDRLVEQAKAYYRSFDKLAGDQAKAPPSIETLKCLLLRSLYSLLSQSLNQSWHLLGMTQGLLSDLMPELKAKNSMHLLVSSASLENQVAVSFGRPAVLTESSTLETMKGPDFSEHGRLGFLVYKLSSFQYTIMSFVESTNLSWEAFALQMRDHLNLWITDWNIAIADIATASEYSSFHRISGSVMYDQCLLELLGKASQTSSDKGEATDVARRLVENFQRLYAFTSTLNEHIAGVKFENGPDISIFPFFWTNTHTICIACLVLLQSQEAANASQSEEVDNAIEKGLSLLLALDSSQTLFRTIWSLQNSKATVTG